MTTSTQTQPQDTMTLRGLADEAWYAYAEVATAIVKDVIFSQDRPARIVNSVSELAEGQLALVFATDGADWRRLRDLSEGGTMAATGFTSGGMYLITSTTAKTVTAVQVPRSSNGYYIGPRDFDTVTNGQRGWGGGQYRDSGGRAWAVISDGLDEVLDAMKADPRMPEADRLYAIYEQKQADLSAAWDIENADRDRALAQMQAKADALNAICGVAVFTRNYTYGVETKIPAAVIRALLDARVRAGDITEAQAATVTAEVTR